MVRRGCGHALVTVYLAEGVKDAYDLFYVWGGVGVADVAESLAPLQPDSCIEDALSVIERDFCHHDGPGP